MLTPKLQNLLKSIFTSFIFIINVTNARNACFTFIYCYTFGWNAIIWRFIKNENAVLQVFCIFA